MAHLQHESRRGLCSKRLLNMLRKEYSVQDTINLCIGRIHGYAAHRTLISHIHFGISLNPTHCLQELAPGAAAAHMAALANLCKHKSLGEEAADAVIAGWSNLLLDQAATELSTFVLGRGWANAASHGPAAALEARLVGALFLTGEVAMLTKKLPPAQLLTFTQVPAPADCLSS